MGSCGKSSVSICNEEQRGRNAAANTELQFGHQGRCTAVISVHLRGVLLALEQRV